MVAAAMYVTASLPTILFMTGPHERDAANATLLAKKAQKEASRLCTGRSCSVYPTCYGPLYQALKKNPFHCLCLMQKASYLEKGTTG